MSRARAFAAVALVLAAAGAAAALAHATSPGKNGQIVYAHFPSLWVVNADGTGERSSPT